MASSAAPTVVSASSPLFGRFQGHEQVVLCHDEATGLRAVVALHSTVLGPALGGTRFHRYTDDLAALDDVLRLSRAMTYKNALAGIDHGGGKAVILGDPQRDKTEQLLLAYGRCVESLGGRYVTAGDVGTYVEDLDAVYRATRHVTGRSVEHGGGGDSAVLTAVGVFEGMRACAQYRWGDPSLTGRRVGVLGVGKVGRRLVDHLLDDGARVVVADVAPAALAAVTDAHPEVEVAASPEALLGQELDVLSPNALGGVVDDEVAATLDAAVVCGGANNQLARPGLDAVLASRGVLYAPDFCVNAGGVIQVADEYQGFSMERATARARTIFATTLAVLERAETAGTTPTGAAEALAEERIEAARRSGASLRP